MKPIWKGSISFGLVNIPVDLYSAEENNELKFSLIDSRDENKIKYQRINEATGEEVPWDSIAKAYEFDDGKYVIMTDEDFVKADVSANLSITNICSTYSRIIEYKKEVTLFSITSYIYVGLCYFLFISKYCCFTSSGERISIFPEN